MTLNSFASDGELLNSNHNETGLMELPFYCNLPVDVEDEVDELLANGHTTSKNNDDGFIDFFSLKLCSMNAKLIARYFEHSFGFEEIAFRGLENGSRLIASHVLRSGSIILEIVNTLQNGNERFWNEPTESLCRKSTECNLPKNPKSDGNFEESGEYALIQNFLKVHGEGIMDVSFKVEDVERIFERSVQRGARIVNPPRILKDANGSVKIATIGVPETEIHHTLVEFLTFKGPYLPNYITTDRRSEGFKETLDKLPPINLTAIDHCVENYSWNEMNKKARFYAKALGFHKFWSVDEADVLTENSALRSTVMALANGKIKMPINEPSKGKFKSQIEEFYYFNGGSGFQHVALKTNDIISTVTALKARGVEFNKMSAEFYDNLRKRLEQDGIVLREDIDKLQELSILVDYDKNTKCKKSKKCNYILQIFTHPLHDRPTMFLEIIQRYHHNGFGKGTFKGLFESIEDAQKRRGNLIPSE